jgi:hypothetical protein
MTLPNRRVLTFLAVWLFAVLPSRAQFTPIAAPDAAYLAGSTLLPITDPDFTTLSSLGNGVFTVTFSSDLVALTVPDTWGTWGAPPNTEDATPRVLWTQGLTDLTLSFSSPVDSFGFEAEPNALGVSPLTATFFNGANVLGTIPLDVDGNGGARLFAAKTTSFFDHVTVSSTDDFALSQLRVGSLVPEPGPVAFGMILTAGLLGLIGRARVRSRRRQIE